jgi:dTDP-L-rhamnose 4-epimerase
MRVLLTGAAGFIGGHVAAALAGSGHEVVGLDCRHPAAHHTSPADHAHCPDAGPHRGGHGDVRDAATVAAALSGVDAVVHHAALVGLGTDVYDLPEYASCNDFGTAVLLAEMARAKVGKLVLASSMVVYGEGSYSCIGHGRIRPTTRDDAELARGQFEPRCPRCELVLQPTWVTEDARLEPRNGYAVTKLAQEQLAGVWARETGGNVIALRYHNVYGPGMPRDTPYSGVAAIFRSNLERGEAARLYEDGGQRRDFVHVSDVARANLAALEADLGPGPHPFNVASGQPRTVGDLARALTDAMGGPAPIVTGGNRSGDVRHIVAAPHRARRVLGFTAEVDFEAGMKELATAPLRD